MATQNTTKRLLFESVREWVLQRLPIDQNDADLIAQLKAKDARGLLIVYHNWQGRLLSVEPRRVHRSTALDENPLSQQHQVCLDAIIADIKAGYPLTKYLSRGVNIAAPAQGNNPALQRRRDLDLMLNSWGIHHLHLSTNVEEDGFVTRTNDLLYVVFQRTDAYLLDILPHGNWTSIHLLEVLVREFPDSGAFQILQGVNGLAREFDQDGLRVFRNKAVNAPIMIDGKAVMSRPGMMSTGTTIAATRDSDMLLEAIENFARIWDENPQQIRDAIATDAGTLPATPEFTFEIHETAGAGIFETVSKIFIPLLRA